MNIGNRHLVDAERKRLQGIEVDPEEVRQKMIGDLRRRYSPQFLGRIDEIIVYTTLTLEQTRTICDRELALIEKERLADKNIRLDVTEAAKDVLAREGYDPIYGARPIRELLQKKILDPAARPRLEGKIPDGSTIRVDVTHTGESELLRISVNGRVIATADPHRELSASYGLLDGSDENSIVYEVDRERAAPAPTRGLKARLNDAANETDGGLEDAP
jgi:ATP-dependent Clp protease ATP-binding subunit ClpA